MDYELAKELKDAGLPRKFVRENIFVDGIPAPTLEELIEACPTMTSIQREEGGWCAVNEVDYITRGSTPVEVVAKLWLALNRKE